MFKMGEEHVLYLHAHIWYYSDNASNCSSPLALRRGGSWGDSGLLGIFGSVGVAGTGDAVRGAGAGEGSTGTLETGSTQHTIHRAIQSFPRMHL